jgi:DNA polymerase phi
MSVFGHLLADVNGYHYPCDLVLSCDADAVAMDKNITDAKDAAVSSLKKLLKKAKKEDGKSKPACQALALLFALVIIQLYNGDSEAVSILDELKLCYDSLIKHKSSGKDSKAKAENAEDADAEPFDVLVELLLSLLSRPSALLRKVTQHVFTAFMGEMTPSGLKLMTDILESSESLRGQQEFFDQNPEDDEDGMELDGEDGEMDSDVEVVDMDGEEGHLNGHLAEEDGDSDDDEEASDDDEEDDEEGDNAADKELNDALANILGTHALGQDAEEEDEDDSDADMTDSEMDALTPKLEEVLGRMQKKGPSKKQEQKDAKENMVNFKSRVLDLLDIFAKKQASNPLAAQILIPLLQLIRTTKTKHLSDKAVSIIQSFAKSKSKASQAAPESKTELKTQLALIKVIHEEVFKDQSKQFAKAASTASLSLASGLYKADESYAKKIGSIYLDTMNKTNKKAKVQQSFFTEWINWWASHPNPVDEAKEDQLEE